MLTRNQLPFFAVVIKQEGKDKIVCPLSALGPRSAFHRSWGRAAGVA
jgi:hypothetical protein